MGATPDGPDTPLSAVPISTAEQLRRLKEEAEKLLNPTAEKPAGPEPEGQVYPAPGRLLKEVVVGYETREINGFTFLLSTQVIREAQAAKGLPFKALVEEFDGLVRVLQPGALKVLRQVPMWIEWNNRGSAGHVLAQFRGGQSWAEHPLKSNSIEVLSLKVLTRQRQAMRDKASLVLLHEMAHAVHFLIIGPENQGPAFAYQQAMDRRLYDNVKTAAGGSARAYAATNEFEYFAELSCAYLDRCHYFPFTRDDLEKYDPTGYRLMEQAWGRGAAKALSADPSPKPAAKAGQPKTQ